ncbi:MAG: hypothetical protein KGH72_05765 [Candidatus Micrarchaeota archaeon]|nr:hypothetical protein [Candidatus Micrarchaeota archaeon]
MKEAFIFTFSLIASRPVILVPAMIAIFFTTIVVHSVLFAAFIYLFGSVTTLQTDLVLLELVISVLVGIFLHAFYVGVAKHHSSGKELMGKAATEVNVHKGQVGIYGVLIHSLNGIVVAALVASAFLAYYHYGLGSAIGASLAAVAVLMVLLLIFLSAIFFEVNVAIMVENLRDLKAVSRSIGMAKGNMQALVAAVVLTGILYLAVYGSINAFSRHYTGVWQAAFAYLSIIPFAIVTAIYDLMSPALYYKQIILKRRKK